LEAEAAEAVYEIAASTSLIYSTKVVYQHCAYDSRPATIIAFHLFVCEQTWSP